MPCSIISNPSFPSYLTKILKDIDNGNDKALQQCACQMNIVRTADGCNVIDSNGKQAAFPFCLLNGTPPETGPDTDYPISFNLADLSKWYWTGDKFKITINWSGTERWGCGGNAVETQTSNFGPQESNFLSETDQKKRVCNASPINGEASFDGSSVYYWPCSDGNGGDCCCGGDCPDPYTVTFSITFSARIDFDQSYIEDNGTFWPKFNFSGLFSNVRCGNPEPKVGDALSAGTRATFEGKSLDPLYFCWSPSTGNEDSWGGSGSISIKIELSYFK
jgi:hypothetical protein